MRVELNLSSVGNAEIVMQAVHFAYHEFSGWLASANAVRMVFMNPPVFCRISARFPRGLSRILGGAVIGGSRLGGKSMFVPG